MVKAMLLKFSDEEIRKLKRDKLYREAHSWWGRMTWEEYIMEIQWLANHIK